MARQSAEMVTVETERRGRPGKTGALPRDIVTA
jgi:hypothetical protein